VAEEVVADEVESVAELLPDEVDPELVFELELEEEELSGFSSLSVLSPAIYSFACFSEVPVIFSPPWEVQYLAFEVLYHP